MSLLQFLLKSRTRFGNFVGTTIWIITLLIFLPFLIYGVYTISYDFDMIEQGASMNRDLLALSSLPVKTEEFVVDATLKTIAGAFLQSFNPNITTFITTMTPIIGFFPLMTVTGKPLEQVSLAGQQILAPLFQKYAANPALVTNPTSLLPLLYVDFKMALIQPLGSDKEYLEAVATRIIDYQVGELVTTKHMIRFNELLEETKSSTITNTTAIGAYGYSHVVAYGYLSQPVFMFKYGSQQVSKNIDQRINDVVSYSLFPMSIMSVLLIMIILGPSLLYRNEPEIRSKYMPFLTQCFCSGLLFGFAVFILGLLFQFEFESIENVDTVFFALALFGYTTFMSAINCRHFLMFQLFVRKCQGKRLRRSYFFPWIWHFVFVVGVVVQYIVWIQRLSENHTYVWQFLLCLLMITVIFVTESAIYVYLTKKASSNFVDYFLNIRTFVMFFILTCSLVIHPMAKAKSFQSYYIAVVLVFYGSVVIIGYLYDCLLLPYLKILLRNRNNSLFADLDFVAQKKELNVVGEILSQTKSANLLLNFAKRAHCEENILFLMGLAKMKKKKRGLSHEELESFFATYIAKSGRYQVNISSKTFETVDSRMKNIKPDQTITQDTIVYLFNASQLEIEELVRLNLLRNFLEEMGSKHLITEGSTGEMDANMENRLRSIGLTQSKVDNVTCPNEGTESGNGVDLSSSKDIFICGDIEEDKKGDFDL